MAPDATAEPSKGGITSPPAASDMWSTAQTIPKIHDPAPIEPEAVNTTSCTTPQATPTAISGPFWAVGGSFTVQDTTNERELGPVVSENSHATTTVGNAPVQWSGAASEEEKKAQSWEMVVDMLHRLNESESELANIDSKALCKMQEELQKVCQGITRFLKLSSTLVDDEGTCANNVH